MEKFMKVYPLKSRRLMVAVLREVEVIEVHPAYTSLIDMEGGIG